MVSPSLSLAFYKNATVAHRRLGLGESIQLQLLGILFTVMFGIVKLVLHLAEV